MGVSGTNTTLPPDNLVDFVVISVTHIHSSSRSQDFSHNFLIRQFAADLQVFSMASIGRLIPARQEVE